MNNAKLSLIQKLLKNEELLTVYGLFTNMPYIECNQETFDDQAFVFESEDLLKEFAQPYMDKKLPLKGIKFPANEKMKFFSTLMSMSIDEIVFIEKSGKHVVKLADFIKKQDFSALPADKRPIENPQMQLSGTYFMQEATRQIPNEEKKNLPALEEEFSANLVKSKFILPVEFLEGEGTDNEKLQKSQFRIPLIKTPKEDTFQPIFADTLSFSRYNKENKLKALVVPFANLKKLLAKEAKGFMLNPNGYHAVMTVELLNGLEKRFGIGNETK